MKASNKGFNPVYSEDAPTDEDISAFSGEAIIEFGAPWCGHCQTAQIAVQEALNEHEDLLHIKVYDGKGKKLGRVFKVKLWPTLIKLQDGKEVARLVRPTHADDVHTLLATTG